MRGVEEMSMMNGLFERFYFNPITRRVWYAHCGIHLIWSFLLRLSFSSIPT